MEKYDLLEARSYSICSRGINDERKGILLQCSNLKYAVENVDRDIFNYFYFLLFDFEMYKYKCVIKVFKLHKYIRKICINYVSYRRYTYRRIFYNNITSGTGKTVFN